MILRSITLLTVFFYLLDAGFHVSATAQKVKLAEVSALTLHNGRMTTGRRSPPVPQLRNVGGSAKGTFSPKVVQCVNQGHDGRDVQWRCDADLPHDIEFGSISVSCEGYDYADDPYILQGSCSLEYELDYSSDSGKRGLSRTVEHDNWNTFASAVVILFILYVLYITCTNNRPSQDRADSNRHDPRGGDFPGYPGPPGGGGGYPSAPPPPYDDANNYGKPPPYGFREETRQQYSTPNNAGQGSSSGGGGFWSGAGLGALGGFMAGRASNMFGREGSVSQRGRRSTRDVFAESDSAFSTASTSTDTRQSSGYGGTTRR